MAKEVQYRGLKNSDDFVEEEEEEQPYLSHQYGNLSSLKDTFFNLSQQTQRQGKLATLMYIMSGILLFASWRFPTEKQCTRKMSTWSPMIEAVEYEWTTWGLETSRKYTGKPTRSVEEAWDDLWQYGSLGIPESKLGLLNKSVDQNWLYTPLELGGGVTALFEGFHQIHCLYTYRDEYDYDGLPAFDKSEAKLLDHVEHCIEMLRIDLMCFSDETPYLVQVNANDEEVVWKNTFHRCRKFEKLVRWAEEHIVEPYNATVELMKHADEHYEKIHPTPNDETAV